MEAALRFGEILEAADRLSDEEQMALVEVLHRRLAERRREELGTEIREARQEFEAGRCRPRTAAEIVSEILR